MTKPVRAILIAAAAALVVAVAVEAYRSVAPPVRANFTTTDMKGQPFSLAEHRGKHPIILTFFATWCGPCRMELPEFVEIKKKYPQKDIQVVVVATDTREAIQADASLRDLPVTWITDAQSIHRMYNVNALPHTIVFAESGSQVLEVSGYSPAAVGQVEALLNQ